MSLTGSDPALLASSYFSTAELVEVLGKHYGFVPIFFWQPSLHATRKPLTPYEQNIMRSVESDAFQKAGKRLLTVLRGTISEDAATRAIEGFRDISSVFDSRTETIFVDRVGHTTEAANELIVGSMIPAVVEALEARDVGPFGR